MLRRRPRLPRHAGRQHLAAAAGRAAAPAGRAVAATAKVGHPAHPSGPLAAAICQPALAAGFARAVLADAGIALLGLAIAIAAIRVRRTDLTGTQRPAPDVPAEPAQPRQRHVR